MNTEKFIQLAKKKHEDKYDYSLVEYVNAKTKVNIKCKIHDIFEQSPQKHLYGQGCIKCAGKNKKTTKDFIKEAIEKHGDKYDYADTIYTKSTNKVKIKCKIHGIFEQTAVNHLRGAGCHKCGNNIRSIDNFIERVNEIHKGKYEYNLDDLKSMSSMITIICNDHGEFKQQAQNHLDGSGCIKCYKIELASILKLTNEEFIKKATDMHGNLYDYSLVDYKNYKTKVKIICKEHGEFEQLPGNHLKGVKCFGCNGSSKKTNEQFIGEAKEMHGDKYDYSLVEYESANKYIKIKCKIHDIFEQYPSSHLNGSGCPKCIGRDKTTEEFIQEALKVHGDKYDYSLVEYKKGKEYVKIICKIHGQYEQTPDSHIRGKSGCPKCIGRNKTTEEFIELAKNMHGDKYDYSLTEYKKGINKVKIICKSHGQFEQIPHKHIIGHGCPKCINRYSKISIEWLKYIEKRDEIKIVHAENEGEYSIRNENNTGYISADGYCKETNTWYEFFGCVYHCNPKKFKENDINFLGKKAKNIWEYDKKRKDFIISNGYNYVSIWEDEWKLLKTN